MMLTPLEEFALGAFMNGDPGPADGPMVACLEGLYGRLMRRAVLRGDLNAQAALSAARAQGQPNNTRARSAETRTPIEDQE